MLNLVCQSSCANPSTGERLDSCSAGTVQELASASMVAHAGAHLAPVPCLQQHLIQLLVACVALQNDDGPASAGSLASVCAVSTPMGHPVSSSGTSHTVERPSAWFRPGQTIHAPSAARQSHTGTGSGQQLTWELRCPLCMCTPPTRCCRSPHRCMLVLVEWEFSMSCLNSARASQVSLSYSSITSTACITLKHFQTKCLHHVVSF